MALPAASVTRSSKGKRKKHHDPVASSGRSHAPSVSCSPAPSPAPSLPPLARSPSAQVLSLADSAPVEITLKAPSFHTPEVASDT